MKLNVFHGTAMGLPDDIDDIQDEIIFDNLSTGYNDDNVLYFSENDDVAKTFSRYAMSKVDDGLQILLKGTLELDDEKVFNEHIVSGSVDFEGVEYDFPSDREELYRALSSSGYQAMIIENNYPESGFNANDIAIFDESLYETKSVSIMIDNKWSMDIDSEEKLESILERIILNKEMKLSDPSIDI